jgi:hypothetical protein
MYFSHVFIVLIEISPVLTGSTVVIIDPIPVVSQS